MTQITSSTYFLKLKLQKGRTAEYYRSNPEQLIGLGKSFDIIGFNEDYDFENGNSKLRIMMFRFKFLS